MGGDADEHQDMGIDQKVQTEEHLQPSEGFDFSMEGHRHLTMLSRKSCNGKHELRQQDG